jgi:hypothetical protein
MTSLPYPSPLTSARVRYEFLVSVGYLNPSIKGDLFDVISQLNNKHTKTNNINDMYCRSYINQDLIVVR